MLLHSGEFGGCAESSWAALMPRLAEHGFYVAAPDWLGFGESDKVVDFADPTGRRLRHIAATIAQLGLDGAAVVGNSMGGTYLARDQAGDRPLIPATAVVLVSGGGYVPDNEARRATLDYDLSEEGMATILRTVTHESPLAADPDYVRWRHRLSLEPGAWQCTASARLRPPRQDGGGEFGRPDIVPYENIAVPTLVVAGADDPLRLPGYAPGLATRIPHAELAVFESCGHMPNIEHPDRLLRTLVDFLQRRYVERRSDEPV